MCVAYTFRFSSGIRVLNTLSQLRKAPTSFSVQDTDVVILYTLCIPSCHPPPSSTWFPFVYRFRHTWKVFCVEGVQNEPNHTRAEKKQHTANTIWPSRSARNQSTHFLTGIKKRTVLWLMVNRPIWVRHANYMTKQQNWKIMAIRQNFKWLSLSIQVILWLFKKKRK